VYDRAAQNFRALRESSLVIEEEPSVYFYRLRMGSHTQTGLAACFSIDEYDRNIIKKHERTRPDKEDDRTRHMTALGAQTGPVFLTYRATPDVDAIASRVTSLPGAPPLFDFDAADGVRHTIWRVDAASRDALVAAFARIPALYIADGHHRAASAARARTPGQDRGFLAVAFPHDQVQILPYNRIVTDLGGLTPQGFVDAIGGAFHVEPGSGTPARRGEIAMFLGDGWQTLTPNRLHGAPSAANPIESLDVSVLQDRLLAPILGIGDVRTDKRIDFVGGVRGTGALEALVRTGKASVAFSLFPVSVNDLMTVADAGAIMPPKSTWFEPKLRDGLLMNII
jgi:uncharacterized protein (DUF1015 family)